MRLAWVVAGVLVVDQASKMAVRLNLEPRRSIGLLGDWLNFTFTENPGMAFGITFGPAGLITGFSIIATILIVVYLIHVRSGYGPYCISLACVLGGAIGNIIDRLLYGMIFDYAQFFQGHVVDFIHFDLWSGFVPPAVPLIGGTYLSLFPIFNVADIAIVGGVMGILLFQKQFHRSLADDEEDTVAEPAPAAAPVAEAPAG